MRRYLIAVILVFTTLFNISFAQDRSNEFARIGEPITFEHWEVTINGTSLKTTLSRGGRGNTPYTIDSPRIFFVVEATFRNTEYPDQESILDTILPVNLIIADHAIPSIGSGIPGVSYCLSGFGQDCTGAISTQSENLERDIVFVLSEDQADASEIILDFEGATPVSLAERRSPNLLESLAIRSDRAENSIRFGETVNGTLSVGSYDEWTFEGQEGDFIRIDLTENNSGVDTLLVLLDPNGRELAHDDDGGSGFNSRISPFELPDDGTYTIQARSYRDNGSGDYILSLDYVEPPRSDTIDFGETVDGTLSIGSYDEWAFEGQAGDFIRIDLTADNDSFDTLLVLLGPDGRQIARDDDGGPGLNSRLSNFELPQTGTYTIQARSLGDNDRGDYSLSLDYDEPPQAAHFDSMEIGETVDGTLSTGEYDEWAFEGQAGDTIRIDLREDNSGVDTVLVLIGPNGRELARDDDGGSGFNSRISPFELTDDGTYTIQVRSYNDDGDGDYILSLDYVEPPHLDTIDFGETVDGTLSVGSYDEWTFEGQEGDFVRIDLREDNSGLDTVLVLLGPNGTELTRDDDGGSGYNSLIRNYGLLEDGTYTIQVRSYGDEGSGDYNLSLDYDDPPTPANLDSMEIGETVDGTLSIGEYDEWTFEGQAGDIIRIDLREDNSGLDTLLVLLGPDGRELARDDDGGSDYNSRLSNFELPQDGTYTIQVRSFGDAGNGDYTLRLRYDD